VKKAKKKRISSLDVVVFLGDGGDLIAVVPAFAWIWLHIMKLCCPGEELFPFLLLLPWSSTMQIRLRLAFRFASCYERDLNSFFLAAIAPVCALGATTLNCGGSGG
jgi:hypothetical protein